VAGRLPGIFKSFQDTLKNEGSRAGTDEPTPGTGRGRPADPYQVLGISREATPDEIRAAYRKASQEYHPDKVAHLGRELQDLANKKFIEIQKSYEYLRSKGGW
jgi:DnaJ-class molecular chaperone